MSIQESNPGVPKRNRFLVFVPYIVLVIFFIYLWLVSGVITSHEKYPNGRMKTEGYVKRYGMSYQKHGHWITYYPDGTKESEGFYQRGEPVGEWTHWDAKGNPTTQPTVRPS